MFKMHLTCSYGLVVNRSKYYFTSWGCFAKMMTGNYIGNFARSRIFLKNTTAQFERPVVQTSGRLRHIVLPKQFSRGYLLEKHLVGAWPDTWRLMKRTYEQIHGISHLTLVFVSNFSVKS